jgi:hypothetical protein
MSASKSVKSATAEINMRKLHLLFNVHALTAAALFNKQQQLHENSMSSELHCNCSNYFPQKESDFCVAARARKSAERIESDDDL